MHPLVFVIYDTPRIDNKILGQYEESAIVIIPGENWVIVPNNDEIVKVLTKWPTNRFEVMSRTCKLNRYYHVRLVEKFVSLNKLYEILSQTGLVLQIPATNPPWM